MSQKKPPTPPAGTRTPTKLSAPTIVVIAGVAVLAGALMLLRPGETDRPEPVSTAAPDPGASDTPAAQPGPDQAARPAAPVEEPPVALPPKRPHQGQLPPLPVMASPRSPEMVRAVYEFAARHPEILQYVPCFCGCERSGHRGNDDCFVKSRDLDGEVTWEPHGMT